MGDAHVAMRLIRESSEALMMAIAPPRECPARETSDKSNICFCKLKHESHSSKVCKSSSSLVKLLLPKASMSANSSGLCAVVPLYEKLNFINAKPAFANASATSGNVPQSLNPLNPCANSTTGNGCDVSV